MSKDTPNNNSVDETQKQKMVEHVFDRREFMQVSGLALIAAVTTKASFVSGSAHAQPLSKILEKSEAELYFRDRLADYQTPFQNDQDNNAVSLFDWNFPELVDSAFNGSFGTKGMPENFSTVTEIPEDYLGMPVAIVGAGAAGLAAGFELMRIGLKPIFYEMQTQEDPSGNTYARPCGRIYSWDYGGNGELDGAGAGWYPKDTLTLSSVKPNA